MPKNDNHIQPGLVFYELWVGAMKARGANITDWAKARNLAVANLKPMATGATNGEKSRRIRAEMIEEVGMETLMFLHAKRPQAGAAGR
ncbi:MAG: hypothetical protein ACFB11_00635 [Paracoccaceae bacterium]|mgnify:CR=1 FL=1